MAVVRQPIKLIMKGRERKNGRQISFRYTGEDRNYFISGSASEFRGPGGSQGSDTPSLRVHQNTEPWVYYHLKEGPGYTFIESILWSNLIIGASGTVATDLNYLKNLEFTLRSEP
jgi:hypothetical protein